MAKVPDRKLAVVTGASSGIGFALAKRCAGNGFDVIVCAEDVGIEAAASAITGEADARVLAVRADLRSFDGCEQLAREVRSLGRPVDALLLNAGVGVGGAFLDTALHQELDMIALNCQHVVHLAKLLVPEMVARGQGRVMMTASIVSTSPAPYEAVYGATKAFVMSFALALREELKDTGVTVTALQPGATDTRFFERAHMLDTPVGEMQKDDPDVVARRGFDAMMAGKATVLGGELRSRMQGLVNELLPETIKARAAARQARPKMKEH